MLEDVAAQLGRDVLPYALLLDAQADDGFMRDWMPNLAGPMTHYGYAFQWFALSLTVVAISVWQLRKKGSRQ
jgi:surfeit locus 1 family protein